MQKAFEYYKPHFKIILYIVVFIVCFGLAILLLSQGSSRVINLPFKGQPMAQISQAPSNGTHMDLMSASGLTTFQANQDIELVVNADSNNIAVTGYDLLFLYDPASISVVKVTSTDPIFDVFTFNNTGYVSVTGTKKLSVNTPSIFAKSNILSITVRAKKSGKTPVLIAPQLGRERTKLVDDKAQIVAPQLGQALQLSIQ